MPFAMSIEDLRNQVLERLPEGTPAPSISWIRLNFTPRNPYNQSASHYTGKFNVKFAVQQRLLRVQHEDSGFGRHQFQLLKSFVVQHRDYCDLQSLDDKAIIPVGEPGHSVSTGVRSHHGGLVANNNKIIALDHDFHVAGIVPSVCFKVEIPDSDHGSFYKGKVHVTVKDKVFEPSSPLRHSTETVKIIRALYSEDDVNAEKPILCRYTDGGPDHRTTYQSVQLCCLLEFIALDLDMIVSVRTAPSQSYHNPAERVVSTLNLALQNVSMERDKMSPAFEMQAKSLKSLKGIRTAASRNKHLKTAYVDSMDVPSSIIKQRFSKLKWTGHQIIVHDAATADELSDLGDLLKLIDPDLDINNQKTWKSKTLQTFMEQHSRKRHYMFQLKKCTSNGCGYCVLNPPRLPEHIFNSLHFVPDPVEKNGEYQSFGEVYGTETDDTDRPGAKAQEPASLRDKSFKNLLVATKVRSFAICRECGKRRVVYSAKKLSTDEERSVMRVQEELVYMCGNPLFHAGIYHNTIIVKEGINCNSMMEAAYYAGKTVQFDDVCFHCGDTEVADNEGIKQLKEEFGIVRPICESCQTQGKPVKTRNALKIKKRK